MRSREPATQAHAFPTLTTPKAAHAQPAAASTRHPAPACLLWPLEEGVVAFCRIPPRGRLGKSQDCFARFSDSAIAEFHGEIYWDGTAYRLRDLDSRSGIRINGLRIRDAQLQPGDRISLGERTIHFRQIRPTST